MLRAERSDAGCQVLGPLLRLYVYGLHGYFVEVMFTAGWEFAVSNNWKLPGCSSVWSLAIYGISGLAMEQIHSACHRSGVPLLARGVAYLAWVYLWEFSTGLLLRHFGACPWDYTAFDYNIHGLITLEYAPLWFFIALVQEKLVLAHLQRLRWTSGEQAAPTNGSVHKHKPS
ncbi:transmembrane protein 229B-like [Bacillus rossius redtenbacheri]|uniref:transmembrane protein 229B-like n=1 Tax=Bacillus rossius redtenbacheri TaxID=93214 RepID=UPI002FDE8BCD